MIGFTANLFLMRKEVLLAIIVGGLLGLAIAFGVWRASDTFGEPKQITQTESGPTATPSPETIDFIITAPIDGAVVDNETLNVTGTSKPGLTIVIITDLSETVVISDSSGKWSSDVKLPAGASIITVSAFDSDGETEKQITVVYSTEFKEK